MVFSHLTGRMHFWYYQAPPGQWHNPRRIEDEIEEIEVIVRGRGYFELGGRVVDLGPGSNVWYAPGTVVAVTAHESDPYETIVFRFEVTGPSSDPPPPYTRWASAGECSQFCRHVLALYNRGQALSPAFVGACYGRLVWEALEHVRSINEAALPLSVSLAVEYIRNHYAEELNVARIADIARVSPSHLHLLFRTHLGTSPKQYVAHQRLLRARELLQTTPLTVKEVGYAVGFNDINHFCSTFRRHTGLSPGRFRKRFAAHLSR